MNRSYFYVKIIANILHLLSLNISLKTFHNILNYKTFCRAVTVGNISCLNYFSFSLLTCLTGSLVVKNKSL